MIDMKSNTSLSETILFGMFLSFLKSFIFELFTIFPLRFLVLGISFVNSYFLGGKRLCIKMSLVKCYKNLNIFVYCKILYKRDKKVFLFLNVYRIGRGKEKAHSWICNISTSCNCLVCCDPLKMCWVCSVVTVPAADTNSTIMIWSI